MKSGHVLDRHRCQGSFYIQKANQWGTAESRGLAARPPRVFPAALLLRFLGEICPAAERGLELDMQTAITTLLGFCLFLKVVDSLAPVDVSGKFCSYAQSFNPDVQASPSSSIPFQRVFQAADLFPRKNVSQSSCCPPASPERTCARRELIFPLFPAANTARSRKTSSAGEMQLSAALLTLFLSPPPLPISPHP